MTSAEQNIFSLSTIITEAAAGNARMQQHIYDRFAPFLFRRCLRYTKNIMEAEDLLQDSFIKIFKNLQHFKGEGSFEGWLKRIIHNTAISHFRKLDNKMNPQLTVLHEGMVDKCPCAIEQLAQKDIVRAVTQLPAGYRTVFCMFVIEGYNHKEIACMLGCSEGTCKSQLSRTKTQLRKKLAALYELN
ncbi:MAG: RNA polymerase sigma factor [Bacteroidetes bacterium]|nr:RNA polymerase sigma factor [Bacteroidota bacterium]